MLLAVGVSLLLVPGPGVLLLLFGGALIAGESQALARCFDWSEVETRSMAAWTKHRWMRTLIAVRAATVLVVVALGGGMAYASFRFVFDRA